MSKKTIIEIIEGEMPSEPVDETKALKSKLAFPVPEPNVEAYQHHGQHGGGFDGRDLVRKINAISGLEEASTVLATCPNCSTVVRVSAGYSGSIVTCCACRCNFQI